MYHVTLHALIQYGSVRHLPSSVKAEQEGEGRHKGIKPFVNHKKSVLFKYWLNGVQVTTGLRMCSTNLGVWVDHDSLLS